MKSRFLIILIMVLVLSFIMLGCTKNDDSATQQLALITGTTGGTYYALGGAMANVWSRNLDAIKISPQPSGASVESINYVNSGDAQLGLAMNNIADDAWFGRGAWQDRPLDNFKTIGAIYPEVYQGIALKNSGVESIYDIVGQKIAVGPVGSGTAILSQLIFEAMDITFADLRHEFADFGDAASKMKDGQLAVTFGVLGVPASAIQDIGSVRDIIILEIDEELYHKITRKYSVFSRFLIPAGTYNNSEDIWTINCQAALYVNNDLDEDLVYQLTKILYENTDELGRAHPSGKYTNLETALEGITTPLHPGALKYYLEVGLDVPEEIR